MIPNRRRATPLSRGLAMRRIRSAFFAALALATTLLSGCPMAPAPDPAHLHGDGGNGGGM